MHAISILSILDKFIINMDQQQKRKQSGAQRITTTMSINQNRKFNKRKREISMQNFQSQPTTIPKSISSISIHRQPIAKKMKKQQKISVTTPHTIGNQSIFNKIYRKPIYLKRSIYMLFRLLNETSSRTFKKKAEQLFVQSRLNLLDQQYFFEAHLQLWQSYLTIGLEHHQWPV